MFGTYHIGWLPDRTDTVAPLASILTGAAANGLYCVAGALLTLCTSALRGALRGLAWAVWASGFALTIFTISASVFGMVISTAALMTLLCPWIAAFGWQLTREKQSAPALSRYTLRSDEPRSARREASGLRSSIFPTIPRRERIALGMYCRKCSCPLTKPRNP
jgi:hypothetical protein